MEIEATIKRYPYDVVHEIAHIIDYRAGRNRKMFSYGGEPNGANNVPGTETGGYWTSKVPGWERGELTEEGYVWTLTTNSGVVSGYAQANP